MVSYSQYNFNLEEYLKKKKKNLKKGKFFHLSFELIIKIIWKFHVIEGFLIEYVIFNIFKLISFIKKDIREMIDDDTIFYFFLYECYWWIKLKYFFISFINYKYYHKSRKRNQNSNMSYYMF